MDANKMAGEEARQQLHKNAASNIGLVWFVGFYGISTFVGYLTPNPFLCK